MRENSLDLDPPGRGPGRVLTMSRKDTAMRIFGREPTLVLQFVSAALSLVVALGFGLSSEQAALIVAAITAAFGVINAVAVRPIAPAAFTALVGAVAALVAGFGFHLSDGLIAGINGLVLAGLAFLVRAQVTPAHDPHPDFVVR
jgi:hypothetical protein